MKGGYHKNDCNLLISFNNFIRDWKDPNEPVKEKIKDDPWAFDDDFDFDNFEDNMVSLAAGTS